MFVDNSRYARLRVLAVLLAIVLAATAAMALAGCGGKKKSGGLVAFLLPENVTPRWEGSDAPSFKAALQKEVPDATVDVVNALNSSATQQSQAETELTKGAKVLVIAAVDQVAAAAIVKDADAKGVPVIAYDRLIKNSPLAYYVSFNSVTVGEAEAKWIADNTKKGARLVIIDGSPTDDNAHLVDTGIHNVLDPMFADGSKVKLAQTFTPGWDPSTAQREAEQYLTKFSNNIDAFVTANDGMSGGVIAALKGVGLQGKVPTSGQDASEEGIQNVIQGFQGVTVFKDFRKQAPAAAAIAAAVLKGEKPTNINDTVNNGQVDVQTVMLPVVPVDLTNMSLLVDNGWISSQFGSVAAVCKGLPKTSICK
jgi:D-xylose transport system substrate-binding protein